MIEVVPDVGVVVGLNGPRLAGGVVAGAPRARHARERCRGRSTSSPGRCPFSIAAASTNALNVDPAWRADCAARLNWFFVLPGMTAVIARIAPVPGLDRNDRGRRVVVQVQRLADRFVRRALVARLDRRVDTQPALAHCLRPVDTLELVDHVREEVGLLDLRVEPAWLELQRLGAGAAVLRARDRRRCAASRTAPRCAARSQPSDCGTGRRSTAPAAGRRAAPPAAASAAHAWREK